MLADLGFTNPSSLEGYHVISWESLLDLLRTEELSEIEVVEGSLDEHGDHLLSTAACWSRRGGAIAGLSTLPNR